LQLFIAHHILAINRSKNSHNNVASRVTMPKKIIIPACLALVILLIIAFMLYSFQQRVSALKANHEAIRDDGSQNSIYNRARCLSPERLNESLATISDLHAHPLRSLLLSSNIELIQNDNLGRLITKGIDCQLIREQGRLLTWPISSISAEKNNRFSASAERLNEFIQAFTVFETMVENRQKIIDITNNSIDTVLFNTLLETLYGTKLTSRLPEENFKTQQTVDDFLIKQIFSDDINEHILSSLKVINLQLTQQLQIGTVWIDELENASISSTNINRLAQWIYWVDNLQTLCKSTTETLRPLLKSTSTSPILLANNNSGYVTFSLDQLAVNDCLATAATMIGHIDHHLTGIPLLLEARGVSLGLVSPEWLTIAGRLEKLAKQPFIIHSALAEKSPKEFACRPMTTDWDDQAAKLMDRYSKEAASFLADNTHKVFISSVQGVEKNFVVTKLVNLINILANAAQNNLYITPSESINGRISETVKTSSQFSLFLSPFTSAMANVKSLNVNPSLQDLQNCVGVFVTAKISQILQLQKESQLFSPPILNTSNNAADGMDDDNTNTSDDKFLAFLHLDEFEVWWEDHQQRTLLLLEQSRPYITFTEKFENHGVNSYSVQETINRWKESEKEIKHYQNTNNDNQVSRLYSIHKKTALMTKQQCNVFLEDNSTSLSNFGNDIFSKARRKHIQRINRFCG
jgi:hypothetical protein